MNVPGAYAVTRVTDAEEFVKLGFLNHFVVRNRVPEIKDVLEAGTPFLDVATLLAVRKVQVSNVVLCRVANEMTITEQGAGLVGNVGESKIGGPARRKEALTGWLEYDATDESSLCRELS